LLARRQVAARTQLDADEIVRGIWRVTARAGCARVHARKPGKTRDVEARKETCGT